MRKAKDLCDKYDCDVNFDDNLPNLYDYLPMSYLERQMLAQSSLARSRITQNLDQMLDQGLAQMLYQMMLDQELALSSLDQELVQSRLDQEHIEINLNWYDSDDMEDAQKYFKDIMENCGDDADCLNAGNRYSKIYVFSCVTMFLLALNSFCMLFSSCSYHVRGLTTICGALLSILNFAAIITTGVFRFNSWGKLSALCQGPSLYDVDDDGDLKLSDDWTV